MASLVTVREHARLTTASVPLSVDEATVPSSAFEWLCQESVRLSGQGSSLVQLEDRRMLRLDNYVGVIESPCGTRVEILPKIIDHDDDADAARLILRRMITKCLGLRSRESAPTSVASFRAPLTEWIMGEFLSALERLVKRGLRFDYRLRREEQRFLRGRLDVAKQLRQPAARQHLFRIEHDVYEVDRPENRLIRRALNMVCDATRDPDNWRLSRELATYLADLPVSQDVPGDFRCWREGRLMAHYRPIRPWCELILSGLMPTSTLGRWHGPSLLFPMETLFEGYVDACLREQFRLPYSVSRTPSTLHLCEHRGGNWFNLQPDFMIRSAQQNWVLDTKWKRLDVDLKTPRDKYGISQSDFYQLYAYGQKYLAGEGEVFLIYPRTHTFADPLPVFHFDDQLCLWVVPFDLDTEAVVLPEASDLATSMLSDAFLCVTEG